MEIDLEHAGDDLQALSAKLRSRVCIIGGGIAGLVLAHRLDRSGVAVTLLEAGGLLPSPSGTSDPFAAELRGQTHAGTRDGRISALGGCSLTWGGQLLSAPAETSWPVDIAELSAFQGQAEHLLRVDALPYEAAAFFAATGKQPPALLQHFADFAPRLSKFIPFDSRNLAHTLGQQLRASARANVLLHAHATELLLAPSRDRLESIVCSTADGRQIRLVADHYVLAAGTVESCRLLLASNSVAPEGVGNAHDQVGRNFHDHLTLSAAHFTGNARARLLSDLRPWVVRTPGVGTVLHSLKLEPTPHLRAQCGLLPAMAHFTIEEPQGSGADVLRELLRARQAGALSTALRDHTRKLPKVLLDSVRLGWSARVQGRRYVSAAGSVRLQLNVAQQTPSPSRVSLSDEKDSRGLPKALVDWHISETEIGALRSLAALVRERLDVAGCADGAHWMPELFEPGAGSLPGLDDARHVMGGACMGANLHTSVVDGRLRVHGSANLSVASAAVFPDGSPQLPTLTLVALSLRLAAHLQRQLA